MKHISFNIDGVFGWRPDGAKYKPHAGEESVQEFDSFEDLQASAEYIADQEAKAAEQAATNYVNLDKIVKSKQIALGMDLSKEGLVQNGVLLHTILQTPIPPKTLEAFNWLQNLWDTKYFNVQEGDTVTFDDILPLGISYSEIATELGF